jgi:hypothetical protein
MVRRYVKTVEEHLRKVVSAHQRDWDERIPIFLLAYRSIHEATVATPASMMFGRELLLPFDLLFGAPPDKEQSTTDYLVDQLPDIYDDARKHMKVASARMKARCDRLANFAGFQEGDRVWLYRPTRTRGRSSTLETSWDGSYKVLWINDVVFRIQRHPAVKMMVHLDRLATYLGANWEKQP